MGASKGGSYYVDNYMDPEYFNTQVQILSSPTLLRRVAKTLDLEHNQTFLEGTGAEPLHLEEPQTHGWHSMRAEPANAAIELT